MNKLCLRVQRYLYVLTIVTLLNPTEYSCLYYAGLEVKHNMYMYGIAMIFVTDIEQ